MPEPAQQSILVPPVCDLVCLICEGAATMHCGDCPAHYCDIHDDAAHSVNGMSTHNRSPVRPLLDTDYIFTGHKLRKSFDGTDHTGTILGIFTERVRGSKDRTLASVLLKATRTPSTSRLARSQA